MGTAADADEVSLHKLRNIRMAPYQRVTFTIPKKINSITDDSYVCGWAAVQRRRDHEWKVIPVSQHLIEETMSSAHVHRGGYHAIPSQFNVIDLFCGAGGASLGFRDAGFKTTIAVDTEPYAQATYLVCLNIKNLLSF